MKPLAIDLFCGLGGWAEGFLAEGYDVIGFDIERHCYGKKPCPACDGTGNFYLRDEDGDYLPCDDCGGQGEIDNAYPGQLVLGDVQQLSGKQFCGAAVIVASPPCQAYSYMAMPWSRAKEIIRLNREDVTRQLALNCLFNTCFRIAAEAGVPLVVENVKGAQPWVGPARAHFGSFYFWGDIESVGNRIIAGRLKFGEALKVPRRTGQKNGGGSWFAVANNTTSGHGQNPDGRKVAGLNLAGHDKPGYVARAFNDTAVARLNDGRKVAMNFHEHEKTGKPGRSFQSAAVEGTKGFTTGLGRGHDWRQDPSGRFNSKSKARKAASAQIAKIPFPLAQHIARVFKPAD